MQSSKCGTHHIILLARIVRIFQMSGFQLVLFQGNQVATQHYFNCFMLLAAINVLHKNIDIVSTAFKAKKSVYSYNLHSFLNGFGGWEHITQPAYIGMHLFKWTWIKQKQNLDTSFRKKMHIGHSLH